MRPLLRLVPISRFFVVPSHRSIHIEKRCNHLRLIDGNDSMDFHYIWLRHNCSTVGLSIHPQTGERITDCAEIPQTIQPEQVQWLDKEQQLQVTWSKDHQSLYDLSFLRQYVYGKNRKIQKKPEGKLDDVQLVYNPEQYDNYLSECYERLKNFGLVVVRKRGLDTEEIINDFLPRGASVVETHFGRIEDLRTDNTTNKNNDQLGYTNAAINLHTDQPFIADPPGMQLLQCIRQADTGGGNTLVNAEHAALYLREIDPQAYYLLSTVPVRFHRKQKKFESIHDGPIIETINGEVKQVRHSYFTLAPFQLPFWLTVAYYNAYRQYASILYDPQCQYKVSLEPGDFVLYDNFKALHARDGFTGPRHVRGIYFRTGDVFNKLKK